MSRTESLMDEYISPGEKLATESNQDEANASLAEIADDVQPLSGAGAAGTLALANADTWYSAPTSVPASPYDLVISKESVAGTLRWSFANGTAPSATFGNKFSGNDIILELAANQVVYIASTNAGDDVNWTTKII